MYSATKNTQKLATSLHGTELLLALPHQKILEDKTKRYLELRGIVEFWDAFLRRG